MRIVKWEDDKFDTREGSILPYDKLEHFILAALGLFLLHYLTPYFFNNPSPPVALFTSNLFWQAMFIRLLGFANEVKDAFWPYDRANGLIQGFSGVDVVANELGLAFAVYTIMLLESLG